MQAKQGSGVWFQRVGLGTGLLLGLVGLLGACSDSGTAGQSDLGGAADLAMPVADLATSPDLATAPDMAQPIMSFFITSRTGSGNLGGLAGADATCQALATAVGAGGKTWAAYLSTSTPMVNAKDRIGTGPWFNAKGVKVADSVADLHSANSAINKANGLDETGTQVKGVGDSPNQHDILTGSLMDGTVNGTANCANWTSDVMAGVTAAVGHFDRMGGGTNPTSWNFAHTVNGCTAANLVATAGAGRFYCFAK